MSFTHQAFFFPTRLLTTFVISVLATITLCVITIQFMAHMRAGVSTLDATAVRTVFTGVGSIESLFYSTTNQEMFYGEIEWAFEQVCITVCPLLFNVPNAILFEITPVLLRCMNSLLV